MPRRRREGKVTTSSPEVTLREVTKDTVRKIVGLKTTPDQERFVAPNAVSIAQAYFQRDVAWFRAIYEGEEPVGFVMVDDDVEKQTYYLWRFMVDQRHQRRGIGQKALALVLAYVRTRPGATALLTSVVPGEGTPGPFYEKLGFTYTGEEEDGELVMRLPL
jgi:diamine N-acetyltransferase